MNLTPTPWTADALKAMEPVAAVSPFGPLESVEQLLHGSHLFSYEHRDQAALLAVKATQHAHGIEFFIVGAVAQPGSAPLTVAPLVAVESLARANGADVVAFVTPHPQLARAAVRRAGFGRTGFVLAKPLKAAH